jgi:hypothetical protein
LIHNRCQQLSFQLIVIKTSFVKVKLSEELKKRFSNKKGNLQRQLNFLLQESAKNTVEADIKEAIEIIRLMLEFAVVKNDEAPQDAQKSI